MRRDVIHMRERTTASGIRTEAVECNQDESHIRIDKAEMAEFLCVRMLESQIPSICSQQFHFLCFGEDCGSVPEGR